MKWKEEKKTVFNQPIEEDDDDFDYEVGDWPDDEYRIQKKWNLQKEEIKEDISEESDRGPPQIHQ